MGDLIWSREWIAQFFVRAAEWSFDRQILPAEHIRPMNNASAHSQSVELSVVFTTFNRADVIDEGLSALADQIWDGT